MPEAIVQNPLGAFKTVADWTLWRTDPKAFDGFPRRIEFFRANDTIAVWNAVALVAPVAATPLSVELLDVSDAFASLMYVGVAQKAAVAGDVVPVCTYGFTVVKIDTSDPVFGDVAIKSATDGFLATGGTLGGTWDGSDVAGTGLGLFLDAEDGSDYAPLWVQKL